MKKTPHALTRLFTLLLASLTLLSISVAAAGTAGSSSDPLVTLSYLNEKFLPELMTRVDEKIGCEVMLRVGTASVVSPSSPGLIDSTGGTTLDNGAGLTKNHLYMMTISDRGVKATAATTKLLVRGTYEVK